MQRIQKFECPACRKTIKLPAKFFKDLIDEEATENHGRYGCPLCFTNLEIRTEPSWIFWPDDFNVYTQIERVWATILDCTIGPGGAWLKQVSWSF